MSIQIGETAEAYVYYRLLTWGYDVHFASGTGRAFDLLVFVNGHAIKVQVKGTQILERKNRFAFSVGKGSKVKRVYDDCDYDVLALVALPIERAHFMTKINVLRQNVSPDKFDENWERKTWERAIDNVIERKNSRAYQRPVLG